MEKVETDIPRFGARETDGCLPFAKKCENFEDGMISKHTQKGENCHPYVASAPPQMYHGLRRHALAPVNVSRNYTCKGANCHLYVSYAPTQMYQGVRTKRNTESGTHRKEMKRPGCTGDSHLTSSTNRKPLSCSTRRVDSKVETHVPRFGAWETDGDLPSAKVCEKSESVNMIRNHTHKGANCHPYVSSTPTEMNHGVRRFVHPPINVIRGHTCKGLNCHPYVASAPIQMYHGVRTKRNTESHTHRKEKKRPSCTGNSRLSSSTNGKSLSRSTRRRVNSLARGLMPKFGDWNENDTCSVEGYSGVFNKARIERKFKGALHAPKPILPLESNSTHVLEDLYKPRAKKSFIGVWKLICCKVIS